MNKKLKVMSTLLCGVLISSSLTATGVSAKTISSDNLNQMNTSVKNQNEFKANIYQEKDGQFIELTDDDLAKMNLKINRNTLKVEKITHNRDIEEGSYFEDWKELNHHQVQELANLLKGTDVRISQIQLYLTACGLGYTKPVAWAAKFIVKLGRRNLLLADKGNGVIIRRLNTNPQIITIVCR